MLGALVFAAPRALNAQGCNSSDAVWAVLGSAGRVQRASDAGLHGWNVGAHMEWTPTGAFVARGSFQREWLSGASLNTAGAGLGVLIPLPGKPCLAVDGLLAIGSSLGEGDRFTNVTIPISVVIGGRTANALRPVAPFAGVEMIYSRTNASLFAFDVIKDRYGFGALAGLRTQTGRLLGSFTLRANTIDAAAGPHPLGRFRADAAVGFRL